MDTEEQQQQPARNGLRPVRSFADALRTPVQSSPTSPAPTAEPTTTTALTAAATAGAPQEASNGHAVKPKSGKKPAAVPKANGAGEVATAETGPKKFVRTPDLKKKTGKKGGKIAARTEEEKEAAASAADLTKREKRQLQQQSQTSVSKKGGKKAVEEEKGAAHVIRASRTYVYRHPKPRVLTEVLFMWDLVAAFSAPKTAVLLEHVSWDIGQRLHASHQSNHLMQRYWNAQWARLVWHEDSIAVEKRLLLPSSLTRSEGKIDWRKMYREEYPLWMQRTFSGVGADNNANNMARVLFRPEILNENKTAAELARSELTVEEALLKAQLKRGVDVEIDNETAGKRKDDDTDSVDGATGRHGGPRGAEGGAGAAGGGPAMKGRSAVRVPVHNPSAGFTRADYKSNFRQGNRKGKHQKGGDKKWGSYADFGDGEDF